MLKKSLFAGVLAILFFIFNQASFCMNMDRSLDQDEEIVFPSSRFEQIPSEVFSEYIFCHLTLEELVEFSRVSKTCKNYIQQYFKVHPRNAERNDEIVLDYGLLEKVKKSYPVRKIDEILEKGHGFTKEITTGFVQKYILRNKNLDNNLDNNFQDNTSDNLEVEKEAGFFDKIKQNKFVTKTKELWEKTEKTVTENKIIKKTNELFEKTGDFLKEKADTFVKRYPERTPLTRKNQKLESTDNFLQEKLKNFLEHGNRTVTLRSPNGEILATISKENSDQLDNKIIDDIIEKNTKELEIKIQDQVIKISIATAGVVGTFLLEALLMALVSGF